MAGIRRISKFSRSPTAWLVDQLGLGVPKRAHCTTCQLSPLSLAHTSSKPLTNTDPLQKSIHALLPSQADKYHAKTLEQLVESSQMVLRKSSDPVSTLNLIDTIQRLGISHHFEEEIGAQLERFSDSDVDEDLFVTSLRFRLLRHSGKPADSDVFKKFIDKEGKLKDFLAEDRWGMLSLYEASYLATKNEDILLEAMKNCRTSLQQSMPFMTSRSRGYVSQALKLPRHLRMVRLEARNCITGHSRENDISLELLQLASLEFNMVQQLHNTELAEIFRWWRQLGLVDRLSFARDEPLECFLWAVGTFPEPYHSSCRIELTKTAAILTVLDDVFDSYGTLDELILFTDAIHRWDLSAMEQLPEYMKLSYMALYNTINDIGYRVLKEQGWNIVPCLKKAWIDLIEAYLVEAKWFNKGYVPTLDEYLGNGITTGGALMTLVHAFFLIGENVTNETAAMMEPYPKLFSFSGQILRLWDDLGTAEREQERGDVASSIQCYMNEKDFTSEKEAREYIRDLISSSWLELNTEWVAPSTALPQSVMKASMNLGRTAQVVYQHGDDENASTVADNVKALFYKPIPTQ